MASYSVLLKPSVEKDLRRLSSSARTRIWARIEALATEPLPNQAIKLAASENLYRLRVGDYRIVYGVHPGAKEVVVHYVRHRREAYRGI